MIIKIFYLEKSIIFILVFTIKFELLYFNEFIIFINIIIINLKIRFKYFKIYPIFLILN